MEIQHGLRDDHIGVDAGIEGQQIGPLLALLLNLHGVKHKAFICLISQIFDVSKSHFFKPIVVFNFQVG